MDLNLPPTPPQPESSDYQNASMLQVPIETPAPAAVSPEQPPVAEQPPLIPVLRKPRIRFGRLLILIFGILALIAGISYGGFRAYRFYAESKKEPTSTVPTSQYLPVSMYLNEVPFSYYSHISWRTELPRKTDDPLRISPPGDPVKSNGKETSALTIQILDNPRGLSAKQLGIALDRQLGSDSVLLKEETVGVGLQSCVVGRKSGGATIFITLPNKKYMMIEQPLLEKDSDNDASAEIYQVFTRTLRID